MKKTQVREKKTDILGVLKSFFAPDEKLVQESSQEEIEFNSKYNDILSKAQSEIDSLETMLEHKDINIIRGKTKRPSTRKQTRLKTKEPSINSKNQIIHEIDKENER